MSYYLLRGTETISVGPDEWYKKFNVNPDTRRVAMTDLAGDIWISTVFLGLDHSFGPGPPLLFETMVFRGGDYGNPVDEERCSTWTEAEQGHQRMVEKYKAKENANF